MIEVPERFPWFVPSYLGDVRLEAMKDKRTRIVTSQVTVAEKKALEALKAYALKKKWVSSWPEFDGPNLPDIVLEAPIGKVAPLLAKALKPGRKVISAIRFEGGRMIEVADAETKDDGTREPAKDVKVEEKAEAQVERPKAAASVAAPTLGCPAPDFAKAEIKARGVLAAFLSPEQLEDFQRYNRFISLGAVTQHRYMITSRHARDSLSTYQRTLYDLDDGMPLCVHDWDVPAAEEMLALHICVSLSRYEGYVRHLEA